MALSASSGPYAILIAALGGEGGGVLMNWIVDAARKSGLAVQATSVPGVAQRTGSTSYYIEMSRAPAPAGAEPVFALMPMPGRVDVVVASELVEAARLIERGFVSPRRTTLIASTSRTYTTAEKIAMGDGRFAPEKIEAAARALARKYVALDLDALARTHGTMVSATMFGALAGAGALPWPRAVSETAIGDGKAAAASRAGFEAAFSAVAAAAGATFPPPARTVAPPPGIPAAVTDLPEPLREVVALGHARVVDFQDEAYGALYLERVHALAAASPTADPAGRHAVTEAVRRLALWMAYEDIPRVAELKTRPERFAAIRKEAEMSDSQILRVQEFVKPGLDEIAAMLPAALGRRLAARAAAGKSLPHRPLVVDDEDAGRSLPLLGRGMRVSTTTITGHATMRMLAQIKRWRRRSLRYGDEQAAIEIWLGTMRRALARSPEFAGALAELPRLLKGYGDTQARGRASYAAVMRRIVEPALAGGTEAASAPTLRRAIGAALSDPEGVALARALAGDT